MPHDAVIESDIIIIGAGVVGLAIAAEVSRKGRNVLLLDKHERFGQEQSSRNSGVIHGGIYYETGSLKAELCLEGNRLVYQLGERHGVPTIRCGKMIVAVNQAEEEELEKLFVKARDNGAAVKMLSQGQMRELEPHLQGRSAFLSPDTGIVDPHSLMSCFLETARSGGLQLLLGTEVTGIEKVAEGMIVGVRDPAGPDSVVTRVVINSGGLHSDRIVELAGIDVDAAGYRLHWCKGEYFSVPGGHRRLVNRLIYPVPMAISVGIHVCLDMNWRLTLGPLFHYVDELDYRVDESSRESFINSSILRALPFIRPSDLHPDTSGIMAMLQGDGEPARDFIIRHEADKGWPGLINLVGIETPGLTAAPAIGKYVSSLVDEVLD